MGRNDPGSHLGHKSRLCGHECDDRRLGCDHRRRRRTDRADVGIRGVRRQIGTLVELRREKENREEQRKKRQFMSAAGHSSGNSFLRRRLCNKGFRVKGGSGRVFRGEQPWVVLRLTVKCTLKADWDS